MGVYNFGTGTIIGRRTGVDVSNAAIANPTPAQLVTVQDAEVMFDKTIKELMGQFQFAVDVAIAGTKITGKCKVAGLQANMANDLFFGQALTTGAGEQVAVNESHTPAASIVIAPPGSGAFIHDLGVTYQGTGIQLTRVASAPPVGSYTIVESSGTYAFNASETLTVLISYSYTVTTMKLITITNQLMGYGPTFEMHMQMNYPNSSGAVVNTLNLKLNACRATKYGFPMKNSDHTLPEMEFSAFADASNTLGTLSMVQ